MTGTGELDYIDWSWKDSEKLTVEHRPSGERAWTLNDNENKT